MHINDETLEILEASYPWIVCKCNGREANIVADTYGKYQEYVVSRLHDWNKIEDLEITHFEIVNDELRVYSYGRILD